MQVLAHITPPDVPNLWLVFFAGFVLGGVVAYLFFGRRTN
jgi:hypothetical protein